MNINQAKAVAGIPKEQSVAGRNNLLAAIEHCKRGIIAARRGGNDGQAAELSGAQQLFKRCLRARNTCEVCGDPITRAATRCRLHRGKRALAGPEGQQAAWQKPARRIDVSPEGGWLARYGFWAGPVQKVVKRWSGKVSQSRIREYFTTIAEAMIFRGPTVVPLVVNEKPLAEPEPQDPDFLAKHDAVEAQRRNAFNRYKVGSNLPFRYVGPNDWSCVFELGKALDEVLKDKSKPDSWLIRFPIWVATDGAQDEWPEVAARIQQLGGKAFKPNTLTQAARRLRMLTPKPINNPSK
jgi:hypothetical protein